MRTTSQAFKDAAFKSQTGEAVLLLLDIDHEDLSEPIRLSSDAIDTPHGEAFLPTFHGSGPTYQDGGVFIGNGNGISFASAGIFSTVGSASFLVNLPENYLSDLVHRVVFQCREGASVNNLVLRHVNGSGEDSWRLLMYDALGAYQVAGVSGLALPAGEHNFTCNWGEDELALFVDGEKHGVVETPSLMTAAGTAVYLGTYSYLAQPLLATLVQARFSSEPRSDAEIAREAGNPLRIDSRTTAHFTFDNTLAAAQRYIAFPFEITLPDDREDQISRARLSVDNVDRRIIEAIRTVSGTPTVTLRIVLGSTPLVVEAGPLEFDLVNTTWDALTIEGELGYETEILSQGYPAHAMTPQYFPGLFT